MMRYQHYYDTIETQTSYNTTSKHIKLVKSKPVPMGESMKLYREKLAYYTYHAGMVRLTTTIRIERMGISPGDAALIIDYSEKLNKERNKKPQSQHWETTSLRETPPLAHSNASTAQLAAAAAKSRDHQYGLRAPAPTRGNRRGGTQHVDRAQGPSCQYVPETYESMR